LPSFTRFLEAAALTNTELSNQSNIARDCEVSAKTTGECFQIKEDTLLEFLLEPYTKSMRLNLNQEMSTIRIAKAYLR
jgi:uncharacterized protein